MRHAYPQGHHAAPSGAAEAKPPVPEPSHAEKARTLVHLASVGTLSTWSQRREGFPFGSIMPFALDSEGRPLFLISALAMHTRNLLSNPKASLLVAEESRDGDPLGVGRVTLVGEARVVEEGEVAAVREIYLERQPNARHWVDYKDFAFYRMHIVDAYFVGGFGVMGWVEANDYGEARPDPLAEHGPRILEHMNEDQAESMVLLARHLGPHEAEEARMTRVDRLGFHLRLKVEGRYRGCRLAFPKEVGNAGEVRSVLVEMVREAREALTGSPRRVSAQVDL